MEIPKMYQLDSIPCDLKCEHGTLHIDYDECPESPRNFEDGCWIFSWSKKYESPDHNPYDNPAQLLSALLSEVYRENSDKLIHDLFKLKNSEWHYTNEGLCNGDECVQYWYDDETRDLGICNADYFDIVAEWRDGYKLLEDKWPIFPLYMLDHSSIHYSLTDFNDRWDSGQVGFVYFTPEQLDGLCYFDENCMDQAIEMARNEAERELATYNDYVEGNVYYYEYTPDDGGETDRLGSFFGDDALEQMLDAIPDKVIFDSKE